MTGCGVAGWKVAPVTGMPAAGDSQAILVSSQAGLDAPPLDSQCLVGRWEVADLQRMIGGTHERTDASLALESVYGRVVYTFDSRGDMTISYESMVASFSGTVDGQGMRVRQFYEGAATAQYLVEPAASELVLSGFGDEDIYTALEINDQRLVEGSLPLWRAFTSSLTAPEGRVNNPLVYSIASITCQGDTLTIQTREPHSGPLVVLNRLP